MKKLLIAAFACSLATIAPDSMVTMANAQAVKSCAADVGALGSQGLSGAALDTAVRGLAASIVGDSQSNALPAAAAADCLQSLAALGVTAELAASLQGIIVALNSGDVIPALAASQA